MSLWMIMLLLLCEEEIVGFWVLRWKMMISVGMGMGIRIGRATIFAEG